MIASNMPPRYAFLDPARDVIEDFRRPRAPLDDRDAVLVLDTGTWNQLGDFGTFLKMLDVPKLVIDHHLTQDDLGATRFGMQAILFDVAGAYRDRDLPRVESLEELESQLA